MKLKFKKNLLYIQNSICNFSPKKRPTPVGGPEQPGRPPTPPSPSGPKAPQKRGPGKQGGASLRGPGGSARGCRRAHHIQGSGAGSLDVNYDGYEHKVSRRAGAVLGWGWPRGTRGVSRHAAGWCPSPPPLVSARGTGAGSRGGGMECVSATRSMGANS